LQINALDLTESEDKRIEALFDDNQQKSIQWENEARYTKNGKKVIMPTSMFDYFLTRDLQLDLADKQIKNLTRENRNARFQGDYQLILGVGIGILTSVIVGCLVVPTTDCR
jgi:hypothetical protein